MAMTAYKLHKELSKLIEQGHARKPVTIDKETFIHPLECDGAMILPVDFFVVEWIPNADDDGGVKINKDGSESGKVNVVLKGENAQRAKDSE